MNGDKILYYAARDEFAYKKDAAAAVTLYSVRRRTETERLQHY